MDIFWVVIVGEVVLLRRLILGRLGFGLFLLVLSVSILFGASSLVGAMSFDNIIDANILLAEELLQRGNYFYAVQLLRSNETYEPKSAAHNERLGLVHLRWARHIEISRSAELAIPYYEEALAEFGRALDKAKDPTSSQRFLLMESVALMNLGKHEVARDKISNALDDEVYFACGNYLHGLSLLYELHQNDPSLTASDMLSGMFLRDVDIFFSRAIRTQGDCLTPLAHIIVGLLDYRIGAWELALGRLREGVDSLLDLSELERVGAPSLTPVEQMYFDEAVRAILAIESQM